MAVDESLPIARQIAEVLEYMHEQGMIYRDLKPANVKIKPEGTVKVLYFGLAKLLTGPDSSTTLDVNYPPTLSTMATQAGMILVMATYMSPEQGKGHGSPAFLPDGRYFLYVSSSRPHGSGSIWMGSLGSSEQKLILKGASNPQFASGHLLFVRDGRIFAQRFDPATGMLAGEATALAEAQNFLVSSRVLAFQGGTQMGRMEWFDRSGNPLGSVGPAAFYTALRILPDGKRISVDVIDPKFNVTILSTTYGCSDDLLRTAMSIYKICL